MKKCTKCKSIKELTEFYKDIQKMDGLRPDCKDCQKAYQKVNAGSIALTKKSYRKSNRENLISKQKDYYRANSSEITKRNNLYYMEKRAVDPVLRLKHDLSKQLRMALIGTWRYTENSKGYSTIGLPYRDLVNYLWSTFEYNYGFARSDISLDLIHIDHIIPLSTAITLEDVHRLNHYTNLQLLFKEDNQAKGTKLNA